MRTTPFLITALLIALTGCSTPPPGIAADLPPPTFSRDLPLEPPPVSRVCKLGTSCLAMDPRPFEACLVGTRLCVDKAADSIEVAAPDSSQAAAQGASAASLRHFPGARPSSVVAPIE